MYQFCEIIEYLYLYINIYVSTVVILDVKHRNIGKTYIVKTCNIDKLIKFVFVLYYNIIRGV